MAIAYSHGSSTHTVRGAASALSSAVGAKIPQSLADVVCGTATWLRAASAFGVRVLIGVAGVVPAVLLKVPRSLIEQRGISDSFSLHRRFDIALCLEVAEHLPKESADNLIDPLTSHSDAILFSAACPGQPGQHH